MARVTTRELNRATLARQGLLDTIRAPSVAAAVGQLGSLQAQHPEWPAVALAARAADGKTADLGGALARREVVRSSLMRITIHVVTAEDFWPMWEVCQAMRLSQWALLAKADPVDSPLGRRMLAAHDVALDALRTGTPSSTELDRLMAAEVGAVDSPVQRIYWRHLAALVPLVHVPHPGEGYGRSRYAIASDWLGTDRPKLEPADARVTVARRYLAAFGPASIEDLVAYVGRGRGGIRAWRDAIATLGDEVTTFEDDGGRTLLDLQGAPRPGSEVDAPPRLLARWDSVLLSHDPRHRDRVIADEHRSAVFSKNADVLPTFLVDGKVAGTWDLSRAKEAVAIVLRPFGTLKAKMRRTLEFEAERVLENLAPSAVEGRVTFG